MNSTITGIVLGKGAPNRCRDGRVTLCAIVLSYELGLIRIYPLNVEDGVKVWSKVEIVADRNSQDNRCESYRSQLCKVVGAVDDSSEKRRILDSCILRSGKQDPIDYQNANKKSIALVTADGELGASFTPRGLPFHGTADPEYQAWVVPQSQIPLKPFIEWKSIQGKTHSQHVTAQEAYECIRKNPSSPWDLFNNMRVNDSDFTKWLLLGNHKDHRRVWLIVHVHRLKKTIQEPTLPSCKIGDGLPEGWPYSVQDRTNARRADRQKLLQFTI